jgi:hypothetical protein
MSSVKVNLSALKKLSKQLKEADKKELQVGWFSSAKYDNNTPVAYVAALNEFGRNARPFIRPAIAENKKDWNSTLNAALKQMLAGNLTPDKAMTILGLQVEGDIKQSIVSGDHAPLSPITLAIRRLKNDGVKINATLVGMVADAVARGETGPGQLGQPSGNTDPLRDTGYMLLHRL